MNSKKPVRKGGTTIESLLVKKGLKKAMKGKKRKHNRFMTLLVVIPIPNRKLGPVTRT